MKTIMLFHQNNLSYLLFKGEHIFTGENKNLDVLFETDQDYRKAAWLLQKEGFSLRFSEKMEKYKLMYCKLISHRANHIYSVHLHREIAWHGIKALDKSLVFERKKTVEVNPAIIVPSLEDSILIHAAHVLFENFKVGERERKYFDLLKKKELNSLYIKKQLRINKWEKGFRRVIDCNERNKQLRKKEIFLSWLSKLFKEPLTVLYLSRKVMRIILRKLNPKRRGCLIALVGANGSGKSTLARKVLEEWQPSLRHLGIRGKYYYYGWQPAFFLTKILSRLLSRKEIYRKSALMPVLAPKKGKKSFFRETKKVAFKEAIFEEMMFVYSFLEYYYRYLAHLRPLLQENNLMITDRYFYDFYGQYPYAGQSWLIGSLIRIFPEPDIAFLLDAPVEEMIKRGKTNKHSRRIEEGEREVFPREYLQKQKENYHCLSKLIKLRRINTAKREGINTEESLKASAREIIKSSWRHLL